MERGGEQKEWLDNTLPDLHPCRAGNKEEEQRNVKKRDIGTMVSVDELSPLPGAVSWTSRPFNYYIHTIDRLMLEKYFQKLKNPKLKEEHDVQVRKDRRGRVIGAFSEDSQGSHSSDSSRHRRTPQEVNQAAKSHDMKNDTDDLDDFMVGTTTRRQWAQLCSGIAPSLGSSEKDGCELDGRKKGRQIKTDKVELKQPQPKKKNLVRKKIGSVLCKSETSALSLASAMDTLDFFHKQTLKTATAQDGHKIATSLNDRTMAHASTNNVCVHDPTYPCHLSSSSLLDVEAVPPELDALLDMYKRQFTQFVTWMRTPRFKEQLLEDLNKEKSGRRLRGGKVTECKEMGGTEMGGKAMRLRATGAKEMGARTLEGGRWK
ncbi:Histone-lysine N-methyltransferase, H3 lysine-79 specific [Lamellibrachia satsuma]|nr:Histone-lysine N-methyltransferase, H3 lysine-79 specific [Lamellibrachia satsuma]